MRPKQDTYNNIITGVFFSCHIKPQYKWFKHPHKDLRNISSETSQLSSQSPPFSSASCCSTLLHNISHLKEMFSSPLPLVVSISPANAVVLPKLGQTSETRVSISPTRNYWRNTGVLSDLDSESTVHYTLRPGSPSSNPLLFLPTSFTPPYTPPTWPSVTLMKLSRKTDITVKS